jgi:acetyl esterase
MIDSYRKLYEPEYGEAAPWLVIDEPEELDLDNPGPSRIDLITRCVARYTTAWLETYCWPDLMSVETQDLSYTAADGTVLPIRSYRHPSATGPLPVLLWYHGGGFCMNHFEVYDQVLRGLAREGLLVIAPDYRLAPEHRFPVGLNDSYDALGWVSEHAAELGGDPSRLFVGGDSSGGNYAAVVALLAREAGNSPIAGQVLVYPVVIARPAGPVKSEERYGSGYFLEYHSDSSFHASVYCTQEELTDFRVSPLQAESLAGLPPTLLVAAECDPLLDQGLMYAARLQDEGVPVRHFLVPGVVHAYIHRPYPATFETFAEIAGFVRG